MARFICSKLGIRLNLSEAREIVQKLEETGIIKEGRLQAEKILLREGIRGHLKRARDQEYSNIISVFIMA